MWTMVYLFNLCSYIPGSQLQLRLNIFIEGLRACSDSFCDSICKDTLKNIMGLGHVTTLPSSTRELEFVFVP